jgi:hypothetical protein
MKNRVIIGLLLFLIAGFFFEIPAQDEQIIEIKILVQDILVDAENGKWIGSTGLNTILKRIKNLEKQLEEANYPGESVLLKKAFTDFEFALNEKKLELMRQAKIKIDIILSHSKRLLVNENENIAESGELNFIFRELKEIENRIDDRKWSYAMTDLKEIEAFLPELKRKLITHVDSEKIETLDNHYQDFLDAVHTKNYKAAVENCKIFRKLLRDLTTGIHITIINEEEELEQIKTKTAYTCSKNKIEFELVSDFQSSKEKRSFIENLEIEYGITDNWDVELEIPYVYVKPEGLESNSGFGGLEIESKYNFYRQDNAKFAISGGLEIFLPLGDKNKELGEGNFEIEPGLFISKGWNNMFFHLNLIGELELEEENVKGKEEQEIEFEKFKCNLILEWPTDRESRFYLGTRGEIYKNETQFFLLPGINWEWPMGSWELELGLGASVELTGDSWGIIGLIEIEF